MYFKDLQQFIRHLEKEGELLRIKTPVSRDLEISEIYFRHARSPGGGKALLFENVEGSKLPVLINAFGSDRRIRMAFGDRDLDEVAGELGEILKLLQLRPPKGAGEMAHLVKEAGRILRFPPRKVRFRRAPVQEVVLTGDEIDLDAIPILKSWPKDGGRFVTLPLVFTKSLHTGAKNIGMYRMQVLDKKSTAMHWQIHKDGSHFWQEYRREGKRMPVSVVIGADPSVIFSATAPMPPGAYELLLAGFIRGRGVPVVRCVTNDLEVPADAEIVLEGYVDPDDLADEGPFGDHTGYYTPVEPFPVFHLTAITMRRNSVYSATVVGRSPQEDCYLAKATERLFLPMLQFLAPEVRDQMLPWDGNFHNCAVFAIDKAFPFQGRRLMNHLWGFSQMSFAKALVMVDSDVNLHQGESLLHLILNRIRIQHDVYISDGILDQLDHSGLVPLYGGKLGVDATTKTPEEMAVDSLFQTGGKRRGSASGPHSGTGRGAYHIQDTKDFRDPKTLDRFLSQTKSKLKKGGIDVEGLHLYAPHLRNPVLLVSVKKRKGQGKLHVKVGELLKPEESPGFPATVLLILDAGNDLSDGSLVLWRMFGNVDPIRDVLKRQSSKDPSRASLLLDATAKGLADGYDRTWPEENQMDADTIARVDGKWRDMFGTDPFSVSRP